MFYHDHFPILAYDRTIPTHPLVDACDGAMLFRLLEHLGIPCEGKTVLDIGAGSGQVARLLLGIPGLVVEALDEDPHAERYFGQHPELRQVPFHNIDCLVDGIPKRYDAILCRGVYHHVAKTARPAFLKVMCDHARIVIVSDEGIREYTDEQERLRNCAGWYGYVISEAEKRGLTELAEMESSFLEHERLANADDGLDFKESPSHLIEDAAQVGLAPLIVDRQGPWDEVGGGFFTATFVRPS